MTSPVDREMRILPPRRSGGLVRYTIAAVVAFLVIAPAVASRLADWLWYRDVGYERVFLTKILAQWALGLAAGIGGFVMLYLNGRVALRGVPTRNLHIRDASSWAQAGPKVLVERLASWFVIPITLVLSVILAFSSAGNWRELAQFVYRTPFGITDPVFGRDVAYYVFTIPMMENVLAFASAILWLSLLLIALPIYVARDDIGATGGQRGQQLRFYVTPKAQTHMAVLGAALLVVSAIRMLLVDVPSLMLERHPVLFGATYADLHVRLPNLSGFQKDEAIIPKHSRNVYDAAVRAVGVRVGSAAVFSSRGARSTWRSSPLIM